MNLDTINFESWDQNPYTIGSKNPESVISIFDLYWQGLDPN